MATRNPVTIPRERIGELTERESRRLDEQTPASGDLYGRARQVLVNGVSSSYARTGNLSARTLEKSGLLSARSVSTPSGGSQSSGSGTPRPVRPWSSCA